MPQIDYVHSESGFPSITDDVALGRRLSSDKNLSQNCSKILRKRTCTSSMFAVPRTMVTSRINFASFAFSLLFFITQIGGSAACPTMCTCTGTTVDCTHQSLSALPAGIPADTTTLDMRNNKIATLTVDMFNSLPNVQYLYLDSLEIVTIESGAFNGLDALLELTLTNNLIVTLPDNAFSGVGSGCIKISLTGNTMTSFTSLTFAGLTALETLELANNQLGTLPPNGFADLSSVTSLDLTGNALITIPADAFEGLTSLPTLNLDSNDITTIAAGVLTPMTSLRKFTAVGNKLTTIPSGVFANQPTLEEIDLQDNQIGDIEMSMFSALGVLKVVKLRSNQISSIGGLSHAFNSVRGTLERIDLSRNLMTALVSFNFVGLSKLEELDLSENQITSVDANSFFSDESLATINLKDNQIRTIPAKTFELSSLITLDLSHNELTAIPSDAFETASSRVENLYLNDNQLTAVDANAFQTCPYIRVINLKRNSILTMAPLSFSALEQLRTVDISFNDLTSIAATTFSDLQRLTSVDVTSNSLESIATDAFKNAPELTELDFANNVIHEVQAGAFVDVAALATLYFQNNRLTAVPKAAVESVTSLVTLDFSKNLITGLGEGTALGSLVNLQTLYLHNNEISSLATDCLSGLDALQNVTLSYNSLTSITSSLSSSTSLASLVSITFKNNSLTSVAPDAFVGFSALQTLDFTGNLLTTLASEVVDPFKTTLSDLRLGGNNWACDCDLQWLVEDFTNVISDGSCATPASLATRTLGGGDISSVEICEPVTTTPTTTTTTTTPEPTTITEPVVILTPSQEINVKSGENVDLPCVATGIPEPTVSWSTPEGAAITTGGSYSVDTTTGTLTISAITDAYFGYYICTATNALGDSAWISIKLIVHFPPYLTNFIQASVLPDNIDCFSLPCDVNAYPPANFTWTSPDGTPVTDPVTGRVIMTSTGTLYYSTPAEYSTGYYNCTAENTEGRVTASSFTFVYNATPSVLPISIQADEGTTVELPGSQIYASDGFAWLVPSGHYVIASVLLDDDYSIGNDGSDGGGAVTTTTAATNGQTTTTAQTTATTTTVPKEETSESTGSPAANLITAYALLSGELVYSHTSLSAVYSVDLTDGTLHIRIVSALATGTDVGITEGTYTLFTRLGTLTYNVLTTVSTTANATTVPGVSAGPVTDAGLSAVTIYYISLGSVLFSIISIFLFCILCSRGKEEKKATYKSDISRSIVTMKEP